ncbi:ester cyclase [Candidatus Pelagibacter bacterium nBUS_32]|uniref:ester cyclase n=1 Tax=Candidatus Pelagibacter bacterium nBUS_32 TaxID=3374192 RepID=UPI003EBAC23C
MKGFDKKYKDFPDFILKITKQIWEGKDVDSIGEFYTDDIPVRSPFGITYGNKPVIEATYNTLKEFPNRQLLGEDVIWNGNDINGYHSSHRILSKGTHLGDGFYGKPTGKDIYYRVIADCACKSNQVYDEWIVRDQGAMVRQIGYTPKEFAQIMIDKEGGLEKAKKLFDKNDIKPSDYQPEKIKKDSAGQKYSEILSKVFEEGYDFNDYNRASSIYWPGNKLGHGREDISKFWNSLKDIFTDIKFTIEHVGYLDESNKNPRASIRWFLEGMHSADSGDYGKQTNSKLFIMGINHVELNEDGVIREWVLFDEVAIWKQILINSN